MITYGGLEMWKEVAMVYCKVALWNHLKGLNKITENFS